MSAASIEVMENRIEMLHLRPPPSSQNVLLQLYTRRILKRMKEMYEFAAINDYLAIYIHTYILKKYQ